MRNRFKAGDLTYHTLIGEAGYLFGIVLDDESSAWNDEGAQLDLRDAAGKPYAYRVCWFFEARPEILYYQGDTVATYVKSARDLDSKP